MPEQQHGVHADGLRSDHVRVVVVPDMRGLVRLHTHSLARKLEDPRVRLVQSHLSRGYDGCELRTYIKASDEPPESSIPVRDHAQSHAASVQARQRGADIRIHAPAIRTPEFVVDPACDVLGLVFYAESPTEKRVHADPHLGRLALVRPEGVVLPISVLVELIDERHQAVDRVELSDVPLGDKHLPDHLRNARVRVEKRVADVEEDRPKHPQSR